MNRVARGELVRRAIDVIAAGDGGAALGLLKDWIDSAASASPDDEELRAAPEGDEDGSEGDGAEGGATPSR